MLRNQTSATLRNLKLFGMAEAFEQQLIQPATYDLEFEERLGLLVDRELAMRDTRRLTRLLKAAKLRENASIEDIDFRHKRGLDRRRMLQMGSCDWIRAHRQVLVTGATGLGKTWLACALGNAACRQGLSVLYVRSSRLFEELQVARGNGSYARRLEQLARVELLLLDDWALRKLAPTERTDLLEVLEDRYGTRSTLVASQLPVESWHEAIGQTTIADAIMDRLVHNAHRIHLTGESMRGRRTSAANGAGEPAAPSHELEVN